VAAEWPKDRVGVGVRLSPSSPYNDMGSPDSHEQSASALARLDRFDLAYVHVIDRAVTAAVTASPSESASANPSPSPRRAPPPATASWLSAARPSLPVAPTSTLLAAPSESSAARSRPGPRRPPPPRPAARAPRRGVDLLLREAGGLHRLPALRALSPLRTRRRRRPGEGCLSALCASGWQAASGADGLPQTLRGRERRRFLASNSAYLPIRHTV
jgi:hypothetical protein